VDQRGRVSRRRKVSSAITQLRTAFQRGTKKKGSHLQEDNSCNESKTQARSGEKKGRRQMKKRNQVEGGVFP